MALRLAVFRRLVHPEQAGPRGALRVVVVPVRALLQPIVAGPGELTPVALRAGDDADLHQVVEALTAAAYTPVDMVERRGELAVRGAILDVFPPTDDHPLRIELWGDRVEEIRWFLVTDQRSLEVAPGGLWAPPCREILLTEPARARAAGRGEELPRVADMLTKLSVGIAVEGMASLASVLVDRMVPVLDLIGDDGLVVVVDSERVRRRAHDLAATTSEFLQAAWTAALAGASTPIDLSAASFASHADTRELALARRLCWWTLGPFTLTPKGTDAPDAASAPGDLPEGLLVVRAREVHCYHRDVAKAVAALRDLQREAWRLVPFTEGHGPDARMVEQLSGADVPARLVAGVAEPPEPGVVLVTAVPVTRGFVAPDLRLAVLTESDLTGRAGTSTQDIRTTPSRRRRSVDPLALRPGDLVVHEQHGVGRYVELAARSVGTVEEGPAGRPAVGAHRPTRPGREVRRRRVAEPELDGWLGLGEDQGQGAHGGQGDRPRAHPALPGPDGHPRACLRPGHPWQRELEDAFAYVETPDQLVTIDEVKADMEEPFPMDRLVCGDVGYGKTEIAVRAAFKAVQVGKQVAVLVPTTLLVAQHLGAFAERNAPFPVTVRALSRFQSDVEAKDVVERLMDGSVDVVIGTHRLITWHDRFTDLGLVVIDEEQRFGVEHKETLKALRTDVDVLAMSATPITRTLELAVSGIREMSAPATPPEDRHPVLAFVGPYDEK